MKNKQIKNVDDYYELESELVYIIGNATAKIFSDEHELVMIRNTI